MFTLTIRLTSGLRCGSLRGAIQLPLRASIPLAHRKFAPRTTLERVRNYATDQENDNVNVVHSHFLAEGSPKAKWQENFRKGEIPGGLDDPGEDYSPLPDRGKLSPTSSHLFKLILPMHQLRTDESESTNSRESENPPTVFLLHPSQPLSHIARLISASFGTSSPTIKFRDISPKGHKLEWSDSTDVGDFIRDAARNTKFEILVHGKNGERVLQVEVPTFADRTRFLRRRLEITENELKGMEDLKNQCDREAHRGARRMAVGGFGMLVVYWGVVARLTFWDLGWDVMEPVTYLSGLSMVILGYLWFLYQGREVSYSSVLDRSISTRRQMLYKAYGLDIDRWGELVAEAKTLRKEISKIAEDYDERRWKERDNEREEKESRRANEVQNVSSEKGEEGPKNADYRTESNP